MSQFTVRTRVIAGLGSLKQLSDEVERLGARFVVVADRGVEEAGLVGSVLSCTERSSILGTVLVDPNPDVTAAESVFASAAGMGAAGIIALGGGSALGAAKAVAIRLMNPAPISEYAGRNRYKNPRAPLIAIPTTAGSGGEVSRTLILHESGLSAEMVVTGDGAEPDVAILDAETLRGLPRAPLTYAALDALSHSIESQWAAGGSYFTTALGLHAAMTILEDLPVAVDGAVSGANRAGKNDAVLQRLLEASTAANLACGNSGLTLVHALSTAPSVHIAHGLQNGILLPHVAHFNESISSPETARLVSALDRVYDVIGFDPYFSRGSLGETEADAMITASRDHPFRKNNRRPSTDAELRGILVRAGAELTGEES